MPAGRIMERGSALVERGSAPNYGVPDGPEAVPTGSSDGAAGAPLDDGRVANPAPAPSDDAPSTPIDTNNSSDLSASQVVNATSAAVAQTDAASSPSATATNIPSLGIQIPTSLSTVIPATVVFLGVCILALVAYNVYRWRKRKAERKRKAAVLPQIIVSYEKTSVDSKSPGLIRTDGTIDTKSTPVLVAFPTSDDDDEFDEKKTFGIGLPSSPKPAAKATFDAEAHWRPIPRPKGTTPRTNARTSSLIHSRTSADLAKLAAIQPAADASNGSRVPRLATVIATFTTTLPDELDVRMGETLRVIEDYADGWCLAERVGSTKSQRGALPQFCLQDKEELIPGKRFSLAFFSRK